MKLSILTLLAFALGAAAPSLDVTLRGHGCGVTAVFQQVCHIACNKTAVCECSTGADSVCECCAAFGCATINTGTNVCGGVPVS